MTLRLPNSGIGLLMLLSTKSSAADSERIRSTNPFFSSMAMASSVRFRFMALLMALWMELWTAFRTSFTSLLMEVGAPRTPGLYALGVNSGRMTPHVLRSRIFSVQSSCWVVFLGK
jgi:hypothetical protein